MYLLYLGFGVPQVDQEGQLGFAVHGYPGILRTNLEACTGQKGRKKEKKIKKKKQK